MTPAQLRAHLRAAHFMTGLAADCPLARLAEAHAYAHGAVAAADHEHGKEACVAGDVPA